MALIRLGTNKKASPTKQVTIGLDFDTWNLLMSSGEPRDLLERLLHQWAMDVLDKKDVYVVSTNNRVRYVNADNLSTDEKLTFLNEKYARELATGKRQRAAATRLLIVECERDLLNQELTRRDGHIR